MSEKSTLQPESMNPLLDNRGRSWDMRLAKLVSDLINPPLVAVLGVFLIAAVLGTREAWVWALIFVFTAIIVPTLYVVWMLRVGKIESFHMPNRESRIPLYLLMITSNLVVVIAMFFGKAPFYLMAFGMVGLVQSILLFLVNLYWKISGHTTAISGLSVFMVFIFGTAALPALLMIPLVAWARIHTQSHSLWQTVAGTLTGSSFISAMLFLLSKACGEFGLVCG